MKRYIQNLANHFGYEFSRKRTITPYGPSMYHVALTTLLSCVDKMRIVQIGANDGAVNDPMYSFVKEFPERSQILLIEPQDSIRPYLVANYAFHPEHRIFHGAVGPEGFMRLYTVASEFWKSVDVPYAQGWPEYRAPTGITSGSRKHVHDWLQAFMKDKTCVDEAIKEVTVQSLPLINILNELEFQYPIDCLQVDAEGLDDVVIYNSSIEETAPRIINFEAAHLGDPAYEKLNNFLVGAGYKVWRHGDDAIAVLLGKPEVSLDSTM